MLKNANVFMTLRAKHDYTAIRQIASRLDWSAAAAFGLPFLLYWLTAAPTIYNLDSAEFTTAVAANGLIRATRLCLTNVQRSLS